MMRVVLLSVLVLISTVYASTNYPDCQGTENTLGVWNRDPVFVRSSQNGRLYMTGNDDNPLYVLHVYGSAYEMGLAHGQLMKQELADIMQKFYSYMDEQIDENAPFLEYLPDDVRTIVENHGINAALEYEVKRTEPYVPRYFADEMKGLADGAGVTYEEIRRVNMFPELIKAACSIMGAWGNATASGGLMHLRALDWGTDNPFRRYPTLIVYHPTPNAKLGHPFVTLGWVGLVGALTGYSQYVAAGEKVFIKYNGTSVRDGAPWNFVFRDMLQFSESVDEAVEMLENTRRTCAIYLGIGDHKNAGEQSFKVVEYSHEYVHVFEDDTPFPGFAPMNPSHPLFPGVVYVDKHSQPNGDHCMGDIISANYGKIDADVVISLVSIFQTGDMHAAIYDYANDLIYVALAEQITPTPDAVAAPAYTRQFIKLDVGALFRTPL